MRFKGKFYIGAATLLLLLTVFGCKQSLQNGKWRPYNEQVELKERLLRKDLKLVMRETVTVDQNDSIESHYVSARNYYDQNGFDTLAIEMDPSGKIHKQTRNIYSDTLLKIIDIIESDGYTNRTEFQYNERGHKIADLMFKRGDSLMQREYEVDEYGNELVVHLFKFRDRKKFRLVTKRNAKHEPQEVTEFEGDKANWTEVYDIKDTIWVIKRRNAEGKLQSDYEMGFDDKGRVTRMINKDEEGLQRMKITFTYNEKGQVIEEQYWSPNGQPTQRTTYAYRPDGLKSEQKFYTPQLALPFVINYNYVFLKSN